MTASARIPIRISMSCPEIPVARIAYLQCGQQEDNCATKVLQIPQETLQVAQVNSRARFRYRAEGFKVLSESRLRKTLDKSSPSITSSTRRSTKISVSGPEISAARIAYLQCGQQKDNCATEILQVPHTNLRGRFRCKAGELIQARQMNFFQKFTFHNRFSNKINIRP